MNIHKINSHCHDHKQISASYILVYFAQSLHLNIIFKICQFRDRIELKFCGEFFCHQYLKPKVFQSSYQMNNLGGIEHTEIRVFGQDFTFNAEGIGERKARDRTDADNTLIR